MLPLLILVSRLPFAFIKEVKLKIFYVNNNLTLIFEVKLKTDKPNFFFMLVGRPLPEVVSKCNFRQRRLTNIKKKVCGLCLEGLNSDLLRNIELQ